MNGVLSIRFRLVNGRGMFEFVADGVATANAVSADNYFGGAGVELAGAMARLGQNEHMSQAWLDGLIELVVNREGGDFRPVDRA